MVGDESGPGAGHLRVAQQDHDLAGPIFGDAGGGLLHRRQQLDEQRSAPAGLLAFAEDLPAHMPALSAELPGLVGEDVLGHLADQPLVGFDRTLDELTAGRGGDLLLAVHQDANVVGHPSRVADVDPRLAAVDGQLVAFVEHPQGHQAANLGGAERAQRHPKREVQQPGMPGTGMEEPRGLAAGHLDLDGAAVVIVGGRELALARRLDLVDQPLQGWPFPAALLAASADALAGVPLAAVHLPGHAGLAQVGLVDLRLGEGFGDRGGVGLALGDRLGG